MQAYTEGTLIEQPAIELFAALGYATQNCMAEIAGLGSFLGRETTADVVLVPRLRTALIKLNPDLPDEALDLAIKELTKDRRISSPAQANQEVYRLLKDGVKVTLTGDDGERVDETVRVIDWRDPANNNFFLASQLWVSGDLYKKRPDLVGFVNGLPLLLVEFKAIHQNVEDAYNDNLRDYKATIPQLFWYNNLILVSNGSESRVGSMTADWDHFAEWKRITAEDEPPTTSLETTIRGTCAPARLLDLVENFTLFSDLGGDLVKVLAKNHQYLGVNNAVASLAHSGGGDGRLGVFWHTQGSGKSYSMVFFVNKVLRVLPGDRTFVIVTDRDELDTQIYRTFAAAAAITEQEQDVRAASGADLQQKLRENHRVVFTLIQKFHTAPGTIYPTLSTRSDITVITDEAHRTQYAQFARNLRDALPNAAFLGFTGTPLITGEAQRTREIFGDYVSIYNFRQAIEDRATVPLYYENRIPALELLTADLNAELQNVIDEALLDPEQERRLERELGRQYHLITREERLDTIAADIVAHFSGRGQAGKAMVVCIDKATTVRMYDKVQHFRQLLLAEMTARLPQTSGPEHDALAAQIAYLAETDMAVVVSPSQNEIADFQAQGLDILPHRTRMVKEDLETKFKAADDPFRIVFVCAMWLTGFDVPSLATIYLDKPLRNHTLMQTIARANRVFEGKHNGLIVDYIGIFRDLEKALAIYAGGDGDDFPVKSKDQLIAALRDTIAEVESFCRRLGIDTAAIIAAAELPRIALITAAHDRLVANEDDKQTFLILADAVAARYQAILPDIAANGFAPQRALFVVLARKIRSNTEKPDISGVMAAIGKVLDGAIAAEGYAIEPDPPLIDLNQLDFAAISAGFVSGSEHITVDRLKNAITRKLAQLIRLNRTRADYQRKFEQLIADYNAGKVNINLLFNQLLTFAQSLTDEEQRHVAEGLDEGELAILDLLTGAATTPLAAADRDAVKAVSRDLLAKLTREKLVLDWRKKQQARAQVYVTIRDTLNRTLPAPYTVAQRQDMTRQVYQHVYDSYYGQNQSVYAA